MASINFNTANQTFRQLLGNGLTYQVPRFQRDYSWTEDEWDDLWQDLLGTLLPEGEPAHYMGYLVLRSNDNRSFDVIDGQQRLTTLSLLVLAVLKNLQALPAQGNEFENNRRRVEQLRSSYIGYLDPVTLVPRSKLSLNRNNDAYYQNYLVPLAALPKYRLKATEHRLRQAFEWFFESIRRWLGQQAEPHGAALARLVDELADRLFFTVITVTDELNAYKVFETLNSRGVRLSATDLLKNYLFSVVHRDGGHENELSALEQRWESIVARLGSESFPDFLRTHWNSRRRFVRQAELFKTMRGQILNKGAVFELLREMELDAETYAALGSPEDPFWDREQQRHLAELKMFNVRQPYPLLLAAHRALDEKGFAVIARACSILSFRYNVIGNLATNEQERTYNAVAHDIAQGKLANVGAILQALRPVYVGDDAFRNAFATKSFKVSSSRNRRVVRYILFALEKHLSEAEHDFDSDRYNLEHVLPLSAQEGWEHISDLERAELADRLGNLTPVSTADNQNLGTRPYEEKRGILAESPFQLTRSLADDNAEWNADRISRRQAWMATQATAVWRIAQLS
jgi:Protein of unknown function DUF262/Protein of unknown function (DUF1524)